ncbi:MAG: DNA polymerase III subunit beta [Methylacidiphilales bacterium]|nr:DNA polymerase III subunit beta [Candidatus Methylacidiphilales bacterium]
MQAICLKDQLLHSLNIMKRVISIDKKNIHTSGYIKLIAENGKLQLSGGNDTIHINKWINADIKEEGVCAVPYRIFYEYINLLSSDKISLKFEDKSLSLRVRGKESSARIKCFKSIDDAFDTHAEEVMISTFQPTVLRRLIEDVSFAASDEEKRPTLCGILLDIQSDTIMSVATDGFRLSRRCEKISDKIFKPGQFVIPSKLLMSLSYILHREDQDMPLTLYSLPDRQSVLFRSNSYEVIMKLLDYSFPDYKKILFNSYTTMAVIDTNEFIRMCKQAAVIARENDSSVILYINIDEKNEDIEDGNTTSNSKDFDEDPLCESVLKIRAETDHLGRSESSIDIIRASGISSQVRVNIDYLIQALSVITHSESVIEIYGEKNPVIIRSPDNNNLNLIMPMYLSPAQSYTKSV